ncbi:hypothetical protein ABIA43_003796 [Bradyrhizobium sp. USDA 328]
MGVQREAICCKGRFRLQATDKGAVRRRNMPDDPHGRLTTPATCGNYVSHKPGDRPVSGPIYASPTGDEGHNRLSFVPGRCRRWLRQLGSLPIRLERAGFRQCHQAGPRRAARANCAHAGKDLTPGWRWHADMRQCERYLIAGDRGWDRECRRDEDTQYQRSAGGKGELANHKHERSASGPHKKRAKEAGTALECDHPDIQRDEKRQSMDRQRKDRPAEQADAKRIENKPKREHGGGSLHRFMGCAFHHHRGAHESLDANKAELRHAQLRFVVRASSGRRSRAAELPDGNAEALCFVGEIRAGPGCLDSAPLDLSGFLPGYAERGALRFCRCVGRA